MTRGSLFVGVIAIGATVVATVAACGQGANGVDACQTIEHARCKWIVQCFADAGNYGLPTPRKNDPNNNTVSESPVDDCMRFYDDACLHGLVSNVQPTTDEVNGCVSAINAATDCTIITNPASSPACVFLTYDAGLDADAD